MQAIRKPRPPPVLKDHYDEADYQKTQAYNIDKWCVQRCSKLAHTWIPACRDSSPARLSRSLPMGPLMVQLM